MNRSNIEELFTQGSTYYENSAISRNATRCRVNSEYPLSMRIRPVRNRVRQKREDEAECTLRLEWTTEEFYCQKLQLEIFDMRVENTVGNLYLEGYRMITPQIVWRRMNNLSGSADISANITERIKHSITKLAYCSVTIRMNVPYGEFTNGMVIDSDAILPGRWHLPGADEHAGIRRGPVFELTGEPVFFRFSRKIGQMVRVPTALLNLRDRGACDRLSRKHAILRDFLFLEIARIRYACRKTPGTGANIRLDSVYDITHTGKTWTGVNYATRFRFSECVMTTLECFAREGFIESYSETEMGFHIVPGQYVAEENGSAAMPEPAEEDAAPESASSTKTAPAETPDASGAATRTEEACPQRRTASVQPAAADSVPRRHAEKYAEKPPRIRVRISGLSIRRKRRTSPAAVLPPAAEISSPRA